MQQLFPAINKIRSDRIGVVFSRGVGSAFLANLTGVLLLFAAQAFLARLMGAQQYGIYIYVVTWMGILVLLGKIGLDTALLRYVAMYNAQGAWGTLRGILIRADQIALAGIIGINAILAITVALLRDKLESDLTTTFLLGCAVLPLLALTKLRQAVLQSFKRVAWAQIDTIVVPLMLIALAGGFAAMWGGNISSPIVMGMHFLAIATAFLASAYWLNRRVLPEPVKLARPEYRSREWVRTSVSLLLISGMQVVLNNTDIVMIGALVNTKDAGIYAIASRIAGFVTFGLLIINFILAPMISELHHTGQRATLQRLVTLGTLSGSAYAILAVVLLLFYGTPILEFFGPDFVTGLTPLLILAAGQLLNVFAGSVGLLMTMTGHQNTATRVMTVSAFLNVALNAILIPAYGMLGAALATAFTTALWNLVLAFFVRRKIQVNSSLLSVTSLR